MKKIIDMVLDNIQKVLFPEELIQIDLAISKMELFAMLVVDRYGELIMSQIAGHINAPLSTTTGLVDRLVKNGYMKRERTEEDRRIVVIRLTEKGKNLIAEFRSTVESYLERINAVLSDEERRVLFQVFSKVVDALGRKDTEPAENVSGPEIKKITIE